MSFFGLLVAAVAVFFATSIGALLVLFVRCPSQRTYSIMLAFSAGVMFFSAFEMLSEAHSLIGDLSTVIGFVCGVIGLFLADKFIPHAHTILRGREITASKKKAALLAGAITIHNVPEGIAIASAFAGNASLGVLVTTSLAIQDVPEGFVVSAPLTCYGVRPTKTITLGIFSGFVEAASAIIGYLVLNTIVASVPFALAFSGGAMFFVIFSELVPDAFKRGLERVAAVSFAAGMLTAVGLGELLSF